jgi:hypothetical protein
MTSHNDLLEAEGLASPRSVRKSLEVLLSGKHAHWAVTFVTDSTEKTLSEPDYSSSIREVDFRRRTITIQLMEIGGGHLED